MYSVTNSPHENSELIPTVQCFLLDAKYYGAKIVIVGEIIPMLSSIEIFLVRLLFDRGQLESLVLLPLLFDRGLLSGHFVGVRLLLDLGQFCVGRFSALALIPDRVRGDLLSGALDPVARCRYQVVRELVAEFIYWKKKYNIIFWLIVLQIIMDKSNEGKDDLSS